MRPADLGEEEGRGSIKRLQRCFGVKKMEKVRCDTCGREYSDTASVEMAKRWIEKGYAPCPIISCKGELKLIK